MVLLPALSSKLPVYRQQVTSKPFLGPISLRISSARPTDSCTKPVLCVTSRRRLFLVGGSAADVVGPIAIAAMATRANRIASFFIVNSAGKGTRAWWGRHADCNRAEDNLPACPGANTSRSLDDYQSLVIGRGSTGCEE